MALKNIHSSILLKTKLNNNNGFENNYVCVTLFQTANKIFVQINSAKQKTCY